MSTPEHRGGAAPRARLLPAADRQSAERRALLLEVVTRVVHPTVLVFGLYLLLAGHHHPGSGFAAGMVVGLGLVLRRLAGGPHELGAVAPVPPGVLLGAGLTTVAGYAVAGAFATGDLLSGHSWSLQLGPLGHLSLSSALVFDLGIVAIVLGLVLDVLRTLGAEQDPDPDSAEADSDSDPDPGPDDHAKEGQG